MSQIRIQIRRGVVSGKWFVHREICSKIDKTIKAGYSVVIFPSNIKEKDLNDMVLAGHNVQSIVETNTYQGLQATLKFTNWKKI